MNQPLLLNGDCLQVLSTIESNSIDAIVTDPPYGLSFMGSGTTGVAATQLGFAFVGIERESEYIEICKKRIGAANE